MPRYTAQELLEMVRRGESRTDWARVDAMTEEEIAAADATDPDWKDIPEDWWKDAVAMRPATDRPPALHVDPDVLDWFRARDADYQARINAVLRAYMLADGKDQAA